MHKGGKDKKFFLCNALAYHTLSTSKEDPSSCAREFLQYIQSSGPVMNSKVAQQVNQRIAQLQSEKQQRTIIQIVNLNLSIDEADDLFPDLKENLIGVFPADDKSQKVTVRDFVQDILKKISQY